MITPERGDGGTVLRGADGSLYFVRDGLLDELRVEGDGLERLQRLLAAAGKPAEAAGDGGAGVEQLHYVSGDLKAEFGDEPDIIAQPGSTIMCPWFC